MWLIPLQTGSEGKVMLWFYGLFPSSIRPSHVEVKDHLHWYCIENTTINLTRNQIATAKGLNLKEVCFTVLDNKLRGNKIARWAHTHVCSTDVLRWTECHRHVVNLAAVQLQPVFKHLSHLCTKFCKDWMQEVHTSSHLEVILE